MRINNLEALEKEAQNIRKRKELKKGKMKVSGSGVKNLQKIIIKKSS